MDDKCNKKCRKIYKDIIIANVAVAIFSIMLWLKFHEPIGGMFVPITLWVSWIYIKLSKADKYLSQGIDIIKSFKQVLVTIGNNK